MVVEHIKITKRNLFHLYLTFQKSKMIILKIIGMKEIPQIVVKILKMYFYWMMDILVELRANTGHFG